MVFVNKETTADKKWMIEKSFLMIAETFLMRGCYFRKGLRKMFIYVGKFYFRRKVKKIGRERRKKILGNCFFQIKILYLLLICFCTFVEKIKPL